MGCSRCCIGQRCALRRRRTVVERSPVSAQTRLEALPSQRSNTCTSTSNVSPHCVRWTPLCSLPGVASSTSAARSPSSRLGLSTRSSGLLAAARARPLTPLRCTPPATPTPLLRTCTAGPATELTPRHRRLLPHEGFPLRLLVGGCALGWCTRRSHGLIPLVDCFIDCFCVLSLIASQQLLNQLWLQQYNTPLSIRELQILPPLTLPHRPSCRPSLHPHTRVTCAMAHDVC